MFTLEASYESLVNPLVEVTVNSKEENSSDFCLNYVQEFSLDTVQYGRIPLQSTINPCKQDTIKGGERGCQRISFANFHGL